MGWDEDNIMNKIIGIDVDGVLADFNTSFKDIQVEVSGKDLFGSNWTPRDIRTWNWPTDQYGYSKAEYKAAWDIVKGSEFFWEELSPLEGAVDFLKGLSRLKNNDAYYFVTQRVGINPKRQTEEWLMNNGYLDIPTVLISGKKAEACKALDITHYIDDKVENCKEVQDLGTTKVYMITQGWNHNMEGIPRFDTPKPFLDEISHAS